MRCGAAFSLAMNCACIASLCAVCSCISLAVMETSEDEDEGSGLIAVAAAAAAAAAADWSSHDMSSRAAADVELWAPHMFHPEFRT